MNIVRIENEDSMRELAFEYKVFYANKNSELPSISSDPIDEDDYINNYDRFTLFYDIFLDPKNRKLTMISPPWLNLESIYFPITIHFNELEFIVSEPTKSVEPRVSILEFGIDPKNILDLNNVSITFRNGTNHSCRIPRAKKLNLGRCLQTLQKDNRIEWISDWCKYYRDNFNIKSIYIYDNGSRNIDELKLFASDKNWLTIIEWEYKFGALGHYNNRFTQIGAMNHFRLKYCIDNLVFNFDIDEYLHSKSDTSNIKSYRYFPEWGVPNFRENSESVNTPPRYHQFNYKNDTPTNHTKRGKYVYRADKVIVNSVHRAIVPAEKASPRIKFLMLLCTIFRLKSKRRSIGRRIKNTVYLGDGYYYHFYGLTNNWKELRHKKEIQSDDKRKHADLKPFKLND